MKCQIIQIKHKEVEHCSGSGKHEVILSGNGLSALITVCTGCLRVYFPEHAKYLGFKALDDYGWDKAE